MTGHTSPTLAAHYVQGDLPFSKTSHPSKKFFTLTFLISLTTGFPAHSHENIRELYDDVAIFGDSGSTGVMAHPKVALSYTAIGRAFPKSVKRSRVKLTPYKTLYMDLGITLPLDSYPKHLIKFDSDMGKNIELVFQNQLNYREMSWGFLFARSLVHNAEDITLYSENGKRVEHMSRQLDVLEATKKGKLPELSLVSFTANDCRFHYPVFPVTKKQRILCKKFQD